MSEISFEIREQIGVLSVTPKGWQKELNLVSWNGRPPKYHFREWSPDHRQMGRGITLSHEEFTTLKTLIQAR